MYLGEAGGNILANALTETNTKIVEFLVDVTVPTHVFDKIFRKGSKGKKGKGKKGGKKGKKK